MEGSERVGEASGNRCKFHSQAVDFGFIRIWEGLRDGCSREVNSRATLPLLPECIPSEFRNGRTQHRHSEQPQIHVYQRCSMRSCMKSVMNLG